FVIGILFGILTILSQKSIGAIAEESTLPILHRFVFACYGFSIYLLKTIFPFGLSAFYPYPIDSGDTIPIAYWLSLIPVIAILGLIIYFLKKKRDYAFALLFYVLNIVLVLQIIQINDFVMADRFMYVASLGLILIMALLYRDVLKKYPDRSSILRIGVAAYGVVLLFMTSNRTEVWKDSISIWNDIINQYPDEIPKAYYFRGHSRIDNQDYQAAMNDFNKVIELEPKYYLPLAYHSRATTNANLGNIQKALADLESAIRLDPEDSKFYLLRAQIRLNQKDTISAKRDYDKIIELNPEDYSAYYYRAIFFTQTKKYPSALEDYNQVVLLNPDMGEIYYNRAIIKLQLKQREGACEDFRIAEGLGYERAKSMIRNNCLRF
ncbi:MAG: tetratricopeptide repeat protein, partial [Bacteroidetes bacterium]|nr:tetratricopeptide repeat protein [Bacteroidota bacterium]